MGKYVKKRTRKSKRGAVLALVAVLLALIAAFVMMGPGAEGGITQTNPPDNAESGFPEETHGGLADALPVTDPGDGNTDFGDDNTDPAHDNTEAGVEFSDVSAFPLTLADGKLEIENLIQYDGLNPDCSYQEGFDIAAVTVRNLSDAYLQSAEISMASGSGEILTFMITDLPAGAAVFAFSRENTPVESNAVCGDVSCEAVFDTDADMGEDLVEVSVEGTAVTLRNKTNKDLSNIVVYCHSTLGDQYFGGITYTYPVQTLPAGGSTVVEAVDCILGLAEVVRVTIN